MAAPRLGLKAERATVDMTITRNRAGDDTSWVEAASCRGMASRDYDPWFPSKGDVEWADYRTAIAICRACPVRQPCAEYALASGEDHGAWGGLSPRDRAELRRRDGAA